MTPSCDGATDIAYNVAGNCDGVLIHLSPLTRTRPLLAPRLTACRQLGHNKRALPQSWTTPGAGQTVDAPVNNGTMERHGGATAERR